MSLPAPRQPKWLIPEATSYEQMICHQLVEALGISPVLACLLYRRGVRSLTDAQHYLMPNMSQLHDPYLLSYMPVAVQRIQRAAERGERVFIYGDCDVDGFTSVALLYRFLVRHFMPAKQLRYFLSGTYGSDYGVTRRGIEEAHKWGAKLIILLDCGIKSVSEVSYARSLGMDVVICDHHQPDKVLPNAQAILNPRLPDESYPYSDLSGCGVTYKLVQALAQSSGIEDLETYEYLDLVALSIVADNVPLTGENRVLASHGIMQLNSTPSLGIGLLMQSLKLEAGCIDAKAITFLIAPRLNACGRMMRGDEAVALLVAEDAEEAKHTIQRIEGYNDERRHLDASITTEAEEMIRQQGGAKALPILLLYAPHWYRGVLGVISSRIANKYNRPTIVLTRHSGHIIGSGRSPRHTDLYAAVDSCADFLVNYGGHTNAAGLTLREEDLPELRRRMLHFFGQQHPATPQPEDTHLSVDLELRIEEITPDLLRELRLLEPFGLGNEEPVFATFRLRDAGGSRTVGQDNKHMKLHMTDRYCKVKAIHGIALGKSQHAQWILKQQPFAICYTMQENCHYGKGFLQLQVKDIFTI